MPSDKFSKLTWHKRTHGHELTGAEFRVLMSIFDHSDEHGRNSHPGLELLVKETRYSKAAVSEALKRLQSRGWIVQTYRGSGTAGRTSIYALVPDAPRSSSGMDQPNGEVPVERTSGSSGLDSEVPVDWTPTDPGSDPGSDPYRSDQVEVRQSPNHQEDQDEPDLDGRALAVAGTETTGARASGTEDRPAKSRQAEPELEPASAGAAEAPEEYRPVGLHLLNPFASESTRRAEGHALEERAAPSLPNPYYEESPSTRRTAGRKRPRSFGDRMADAQ
ncbi:helix-turn-helix domain-containing protein [Rhodococcus globerulus]|uniref:helix-turn-helix domain-containing protein n=1 Tax=Rhodococcus globerulus TaxID=33008 RepID=UPI000A9C76F1|nr:helix-turn-helix domain-containing protein [Rhodococcus globerulus]